MCEGNSQVFSEEFSGVPRTSAQVAQQASASGITGVLGVSAMDNSVTIITTVGASIVHGRCPLLLPDDQLIEKRRHQNHGRIPERPVHARGLALAVRSRLPTVSRGAGTRCCAQASVKRRSGLAVSRWSWASVVPPIWTVGPGARRPDGLRERGLGPAPGTCGGQRAEVVGHQAKPSDDTGDGPQPQDGLPVREKMLRVGDG
jgi:hypothetical protein